MGGLGSRPTLSVSIPRPARDKRFKAQNPQAFPAPSGRPGLRPRARLGAGTRPPLGGGLARRNWGWRGGPASPLSPSRPWRMCFLPGARAGHPDHQALESQQHLKFRRSTAAQAAFATAAASPEQPGSRTSTVRRPSEGAVMSPPGLAQHWPASSGTAGDEHHRRRLVRALRPATARRFAAPPSPPIASIKTPQTTPSKEASREA